MTACMHRSICAAGQDPCPAWPSDQQRAVRQLCHITSIVTITVEAMHSVLAPAGSTPCSISLASWRGPTWDTLHRRKMLPSSLRSWDSRLGRRWGATWAMPASRVALMGRAHCQ